MNRQNWSLEEDNALTKYVQRLGVSDWTSIAQYLRSDCRSSTRTGKQCRERWYNHLIPTVNKKTWSSQQQTKLFQTHRYHGNKWKDIAKQIEGRYGLLQCRTDNDIKNHFYSTLRRSLRRLNKIIGEKNSTSQIREIKPSVLTTIMDYIYKHHETQENQLLSSLKELPMLILEFASFKPKKGNYGCKLNDDIRDKIETILNLVTEFNKSYCKQKKESKEIKIQKVDNMYRKRQKDDSKQKSTRYQLEAQVKKQQVSEKEEDSMEIEEDQVHSFIQKHEQQQEDVSKYITYVKTETEMRNQFHQPSCPCSFNMSRPMHIHIGTNFLLPNPKNSLMFDDYFGQLPDAMHHIEDPSALDQESHISGLQIVGTHWSPQAWQRAPQGEIDPTDQIFEMNYDNNI